jgi:mono/diheme cytochrome c family protein
MRSLSLALFVPVLACLSAAEPPPPSLPPPISTAARLYSLSWDNPSQLREAKRGETTARFVFAAVNRGAEPVEIRRVQPSCSCTVVHTPPKPWVVAPGAATSFDAEVDFSGKEGRVTKTLLVDTTEGSQQLEVTIAIPAADAGQRERNRQLALQNRQRVFEGDCARCHAEPARGRVGAELYGAACAVCHDAAHRADMVPSLASLSHAPAEWRAWIAGGREGTLMPAFAAEHGGPLSREQIDSLVEYLLSRTPAGAPHPPHPSGPPRPPGPPAP